MVGDGRRFRPVDGERVELNGDVAQRLTVAGPGGAISTEVVILDLGPVAGLQQAIATAADGGPLRSGLMLVVGAHEEVKGLGVPVHGVGGGVAGWALVGAGVAGIGEQLRGEGGAIGAGAAVRQADAMRQRGGGEGVVGVEEGHCVWNAATGGVKLAV